ncbi:MAG: hypothetical protein HOP15_10805 [Planctomycetes bacterium]|nr:hypothetical protein [Planctomycetota bacterium]
MSVSVIQQLAERLQTSEPGNAHEQRELFERIRELRSAFDGPLDPESHRYLEAAGMLVAYLARMGSLAGEDVRTIAVRLLRSAAEVEVSAAEASAAGASAPTRAPTPPVRPQAFPQLRPHAQPPAAVPRAEENARTATDVMGDMLLGQILLQRGHILDEHIQQAMKVQRGSKLRLGDIFVKIGACSRAQVAEALNHQAQIRRVRDNLAESEPQKPQVDTRGTGLKLVGEAMIGEILVERNVITRRQLERALEVQKQTGARIGDALVKLGATTIDQIEQALHFQGRERRFGGKGSPTQPGKGASDGKR